MLYCLIVKLVFRVIAAVFLLPVTVAGAVPAVIILLDPWRRSVFWPGAAVPAAGIALTTACVRAFYLRGRGTLAPWDAPEELVVGGPYRFCRNPMYAGVVLTIIGLSVLFVSPLLLPYAAVTAAAFHLRVVKYEEPRLQALFGERWTAYEAGTNRWLPGPGRRGAL